MSNEVYENEAHKMKIGYIVYEMKAFSSATTSPWFRLLTLFSSEVGMEPATKLFWEFMKMVIWKHMKYEGCET